jgi:hypothetical protein
LLQAQYFFKHQVIFSWFHAHLRDHLLQQALIALLLNSLAI